MNNGVSQKIFQWMTNFLLWIKLLNYKIINLYYNIKLYYNTIIKLIIKLYYLIQQYLNAIIKMTKNSSHNFQKIISLKIRTIFIKRIRRRIII